MSNLNNYSFRNKILVSFFVIVFIFGGYSIYLSNKMSETSEIGYELTNTNIPELLWISHWQRSIVDEKYVLERFLANHSYNLLEGFYEYEARVIPLESMVERPKSLEAIEREIEQISFIYENKVQGLLSYENYLAAEQVIKDELLPSIMEMEGKLEDLYKEKYASMNVKTNTFSESITQNLWVLFIVTTMAIILCIYFSLRISRSLTSPIYNLVKKVDSISQGEYGLQVPSVQQYEFQQLRKSINTMSHSLKQSFETLSYEKMFREKILSSIPIGIITVNEGKEEIEVNDKALELIGTDEKELYAILKGTARPVKNNKFWEWFQSGQFFKTKKTTLSSDQEYKLLVSQSPLVDHENNIIGRLFYFIDVSEIDSLEQRIYRSEKLAIIGELAAGSAHEIRNPLAVIHGFIYLMKTSLSEEEQEKYQVSLILKELERINKIISDMLLLAKPSAPKMMVGEFHQEVLEPIIPLFEATIPRDVNINVNITSFKLYFDPEQLKQVFYNLIRNSIEAIGGAGEINIYSMASSDDVEIFVQDSGSGIPANIVDSIFEPFVSSKEDGTGLGLTIIQRIIETHQGEIELLSSSEMGTTFKIRLPIIK